MEIVAHYGRVSSAAGVYVCKGNKRRLCSARRRPHNSAAPADGAAANDGHQYAHRTGVGTVQMEQMEQMDGTARRTYHAVRDVPEPAIHCSKWCTENLGSGLTAEIRFTTQLKHKTQPTTTTNMAAASIATSAGTATAMDVDDEHGPILFSTGVGDGAQVTVGYKVAGRMKTIAKMIEGDVRSAIGYL